MKARPKEPLALFCEARIRSAPCQGRPSHRHHILRRSQGGTDSPRNTMDVCWACHEFIHANPATSYELGFLKHSWEAAS